MLACQFMMVAMSAIKRFDSLLLHAWSSVRETLANARFWKNGGEAEW
jgi:hypothetical protein